MVCGFSLVIAGYRPVTARSLSQRQGQHLDGCIRGSPGGPGWVHMHGLGINQDKVAEENLPGDFFMDSRLLATSNFGAAVFRFFVDLESNRCWYTHQNFYCIEPRTAGDHCRHPMTKTARADPAGTYGHRGSLSKATVSEPGHSSHGIPDSMQTSALRLPHLLYMWSGEKQGMGQSP